MSDVTVAGESAELLREALLQVNLRTDRHGMTRVSATLDARLATPLFRALMRVEAELLIQHADAYGLGTGAYRAPPQRRADAFIALVGRVAEALGTANDEAA